MLFNLWLKSSCVTTPDPTVETTVWTAVTFSPKSPDLAPSDFHLFGPPKDARWKHRFALKHGLREKLRRLNKEFYATGIQRLRQRWENGVDCGDVAQK